MTHGFIDLIAGKNMAGWRYRTSAAIVVVSALALSASIPASAVPDTTGPSDAQMQSARNHEQATQASLSSIEQELNQLSSESTRLESEAVRAQEESDKAGQAVFDAMEEAELAKERAESAQQDVNAARSRMASAAQAMYRNSSSEISEAYYFFGADSLSQANARSRAYERVAEYTDHQAKDFQTLQAVADTLQSQAQAKLKESEKLAKKANQAADEAKSAAAAAQQQIQTADARREELAVELAKAHNTTVQLEQEKLAAQEARRKAEAEAAEKAAREAAQRAQAQREAAAKAAAEQAAAQQAAAQQAAQRAANTSVSQVATPAPRPTVSASGGQALRDQIVAYAKTFNGTPYVWGGTSPNGWDCSGFVQYVHRHFGINLPRTADAQARAGRQISAAEARPGDLVWWPGQHVAIYLGGNNTFAANNPAQGTTYSVLYGSYVFIRVVN